MHVDISSLFVTKSFSVCMYERLEVCVRARGLF